MIALADWETADLPRRYGQCLNPKRKCRAVVKRQQNQISPAAGLQPKLGMPIRFSLYLILVTVGAGLFCTGFLSGWIASRRLIVISDANRQPPSLTFKGHASNSVRTEVLAVLKAFQDGYTRRDVRQVDRFMRQLFLNDDGVIVVGTNSGEWVEGYDSIARFIATDWASWGNLRLAVDDAVINSDGNVAWLATAGKVTFERSAHPIKFTAVLSRADDRWLFRQLQFQWDESPIGLADLPHFGVLSRLHLR